MKFTRIQIDNFYNLKNVDLDLTNGNVLIVGPNGSGKSNIVKCIDFLVKCIFEKEDKELKVWDVNEPKWYVRVEAELSEDEEKLLLNLRICYLLFTVGLIIKRQPKHRESTDQPVWTPRVHRNNSDDDKPWEASSTVEEAFARLHPALMKISEEIPATNEKPGDASSVSMWIETKDVGGDELSCSHRIRMRAPNEHQREKMKKSILATIKHVLGGQSKRGDLKKDISELVDDEEWYKKQEVYFAGTYRCPKEPFKILKRSIAFSSWMRECTEPIKVYFDPLSDPAEVRYIEEKILFHARRFSSIGLEIVKYLLENCLRILPQSRELSGSEDVASLDMKKVEQMLIDAKICSESRDKKDRFACVTQALKSFCDLDIRVRKKEFNYRHANRKIDKNVRDLAQLFDKRTRRLENDWRDTDVEERLLDIANEAHQQQKIAPSWTGGLQVQVTRTLLTNDKPYSVTTPLSGLSGGEIEVLMTLCAVHLSGATNVFLDEPGHSLHPPMQAQLRRWLETHGPSNQVRVVISHSTEFLSPQSLNCLYHMSFVGRGFTPFRLRLDDHVATSERKGATNGKRPPGSVEEANSPVSDKEVRETPGPSGSKALPSEVNEDQDSETSSNSSRLDDSETEISPMETDDQSSSTSSNRATLRENQCPPTQASESQVAFSQESITMLMRPDMRKMFFATGLYLVEGATDKRVLSALRQVLMEEAGAILETSKDTRELNQAMKVQEMDRWDILELGGCGDAIKAYKAATSLKIPCAVVLDFDAITAKHGTQVQPFNRANWERSKLYKALRKEQESLSLAKTSLQEVEDLLKEERTGDEASRQARNVMKKHGFFIWENDLEAAICNNQTTRKNLLEIKNFLDIVGEEPPCSLPHESRTPMSIEVAQENYDRVVLAVLQPLLDDLAAELEGARERIAGGNATGPITPVTDKAQKLIAEISKNKQVLSKHDSFVKKGTRQKDDSGGESRMKGAEKPRFPDESGTSSDGGPTPGQQAEPDAENDASSSTDQPDTKERQETDKEREARERLFWSRVQQKLHDEGWARMPWEILLEVLKVCLQDEQSPLAELCRFMKDRQIKGKKRKRDFPQDLISRILGSTDDMDE